MATGMAGSKEWNPYALWLQPLAAMMSGYNGLALAPHTVQQAINPLSFSINYVTNRNSTAPDVERDILEQHSYGRQLGRMMDALSALVEAQPGLASDERIDKFRKLATEIAAIKAQSKEQTFDRLQREIGELERADPQGYRELKRRLAAS